MVDVLLTLFFTVLVIAKGTPNSQIVEFSGHVLLFKQYVWSQETSHVPKNLMHV